MGKGKLAVRHPAAKHAADEEEDEDLEDENDGEEEDEDEDSDVEEDEGEKDDDDHNRPVCIVLVTQSSDLTAEQTAEVAAQKKAQHLEQQRRLAGVTDGTTPVADGPPALTPPAASQSSNEGMPADAKELASDAAVQLPLSRQAIKQRVKQQFHQRKGPAGGARLLVDGLQS
jgi:hypothetical protein